VFRRGRLLWRDDVLHQLKLDKLPAAHCPHNIVMGSQEFVSVNRALLSKEVSREAANWMASRKWELGKGYESKKSSQMVSERAKATRLPEFLTSSLTLTKVLKEESHRMMRRTEHYWSCSGNFLGSTRPPKGYERSIYSRREVRSERAWWQDRVHVDEVRVPKAIWEAHNPPWQFDGFCKLLFSSSVPRSDLVASLRTQTTPEAEGIFYSGIAERMKQLPVLTFVRQFFEWAV